MRPAPLAVAGLALLTAAFASPAPALAEAQAVHLKFEAYWGGLHVADFALSLENGGQSYENRFHLETRGLTRFFSNLSVKAQSRGRIESPPPPMPGNDNVENASTLPVSETYIAEHYRTEYTNSKHFRWVDIEFGQADEPARAVTGTRPIPGREDDWDPDEKGPEVLDRVEPEQTIGANDPVTLIPQLMAVVRRHLTGGPKSGVIKGFDGRRRFDMDVTYLGLATREIGGRDVDTYHVRITPKPGAGFKDRHRKAWEGALFDFYLSRDGRFVPMQIVPVKRGPVMTLVAECSKMCDVPIEEE